MNVVISILTLTKFLLNKFTLLHSRQITDTDFIQPQTDTFDDDHGGGAHSTFLNESFVYLKSYRMPVCDFTLIISNYVFPVCVCACMSDGSIFY